MHLVTDTHPALDRGADPAGLTRLGEWSATSVFGQRRITTAQSTCGDWSYWLEPHPEDVFCVAVRYRPTGQVRTFDTLDIDVARAWTASGARRDLFVDAVNALNDPHATEDQRATAMRAARVFDVLGAICVCGAYLAHMPGDVWVHVDVCDDCLADPHECSTIAIRRAGHAHYRRQVSVSPRVSPAGYITVECGGPEPDRCTHTGCNAPNRGQCDAGGPCCAGDHDCGPLPMPGPLQLPRQRAAHWRDREADMLAAGTNRAVTVAREALTDGDPARALQMVVRAADLDARLDRVRAEG